MTVTLDLQHKVDLKSLHTFSLPATANSLVTLSSLEQLSSLANLVKQLPDKPIILGGGSNTVFNGNIKPLIIHVALRGIKLISEDDNQVVLQIAAGENWHQLVKYCLKHGYGGIENLALIPGTVGAAPVQNIGAYGVEISSVIDMVSVFDLEQAKSLTLTATDCGFSYRDSIFKHHPYANRYLITSVNLRLQKKPNLNLEYGAIKQTLVDNNLTPTMQNVAAAVIQIRRSKLPDPLEISNAGSFFKNPIISDTEFARLQRQHPDIPHYKLTNNNLKIPAGWLIEKCGWKGKQIDNLGCYAKQALILVNYGGGNGASLNKLIKQIIASVKNKFALNLEAEVNLIGFSDS